MNWAFGFRTANTRHPLYFIKSEHERHATEKIVYYTAKIVVIFYPKLNEQKHYLEHEVLQFCFFVNFLIRKKF
jgi:microtubule-associated protein-like 5